MTGLWVAAFVALSLTQDEGPPDVSSKTCVITLKNGHRLPVFWRQREEMGNDVLRLKIDEPWLDEPRYEFAKKSDIVDQGPDERPKEREQRIREAGYIKVNGRYRTVEEVEYADRARRMAGVTDAAKNEAGASPAPTVDVPPAPPRDEGREKPRSDVLVQWGERAAVILAGVMLIALVGKFLLR